MRHAIETMLQLRFLEGATGLSLADATAARKAIPDLDPRWLCHDTPFLDAITAGVAAACKAFAPTQEDMEDITQVVVANLSITYARRAGSYIGSPHFRNAHNLINRHAWRRAHDHFNALQKASLSEPLDAAGDLDAVAFFDAQVEAHDLLESNLDALTRLESYVPKRATATPPKPRNFSRPRKVQKPRKSQSPRELAKIEVAKKLVRERGVHSAARAMSVSVAKMNSWVPPVVEEPTEQKATVTQANVSAFCRKSDARVLSLWLDDPMQEPMEIAAKMGVSGSFVNAALRRTFDLVGLEWSSESRRAA